ncbi:HET-domain-containing protein [Aspergillus taichungensis]|uniref:HET-domain-containing protein n=1 Tax=Aspergillus taichungensis TaxID=482145 RepID=A0A2J5HIS2_9EURO|nr:HET-domain-containing protein [Aspergillus taichungensis]
MEIELDRSNGVQPDECHFCKEVVCEERLGHAEDPQELFHAPCAKCAVSDTGPDASFCLACRHLRLPHLICCLRLAVNDPVYVPLGTLGQLRDKRCQFCQFLVRTLSTFAHHTLRNDQLDAYSVVLWAFEASLKVGLEDGDGEALVDTSLPAWIQTYSLQGERELATVGVNHNGTPFDRLPVMTEYVDWEQVRLWIQEDLSRTASKADDPSEPIPGLKVIDVHQDRVVKATADCAYLALSYVFGTANTVDVPASGLFNRQALPLTIRDAIIACEAIGMRYLWIDQLCIQQSDAIDKLQQINLMDRIYQGAVCTLVAVAADDGHYGLPGVTKPRTWAYPTCQIGNAVLSGLTTSPSWCIRYSKWYTRGWTLQEALFSSRFLAFADHGVHYGRRYPDDFDFSSEHYSDLSNEDSVVVPALGDFWTTLDDYTGRDLSFPSDILRAFTGVLRSIHGDNTYYGLPSSAIDRAVLWTLTNKQQKPHRPRPGYPSWSWTSHNGPTTHIHPVAALSIWAIPRPGSPPTICQPARGTKWDENRKGQPIYIMAPIVIAWLTGCIRSPFPGPPSTPTPPTITASSLDALSARWPTHDAYWQDAFGQAATNIDTLFTPQVQKTASSHPGRILIHAQTPSTPSSFTIQRPPHRRHNHNHPDNLFHIRSSHTGTFAGTIHIPTYNADPSILSHGELQFLALSIGKIDDDAYAIAREENYPGDVGLFSGGDVLKAHLGSSDSMGVSRLAELQAALPINVMLVVRSESESERDSESGVNLVRRLGVGYIFLREWVQAGVVERGFVLE